MALPPPWIAVYKQLVTLHRPEGPETKALAQDLVKCLKAAGLEIVPAYAVDEGKLHVDIGLGRHILKPGDTLTQSVKVERPTQ